MEEIKIKQNLVEFKCLKDGYIEEYYVGDNTEYEPDLSGKTKVFEEGKVYTYEQIKNHIDMCCSYWGSAYTQLTGNADFGEYGYSFPDGLEEMFKPQFVKTFVDLETGEIKRCDEEPSENKNKEHN